MPNPRIRTADFLPAAWQGSGLHGCYLLHQARLLRFGAIRPLLSSYVTRQLKRTWFFEGADEPSSLLRTPEIVVLHAAATYSPARRPRRALDPLSLGGWTLKCDFHNPVLNILQRIVQSPSIFQRHPFFQRSA